jgi:hypothetical protein
MRWVLGIGVSLALLALTSSFLLGQASATSEVTRDVSPLDGLVIRTDVTVGPYGAPGSYPGCPSVALVNRTVGAASAQTIQPSVAGWRDGHRPLGNVGGPFRIGTQGGAVVFLIAGWHLRSPDGHLYQFDVNTAANGCVPLQRVASPAGDVFSIRWNAGQCDTNGNNCSLAFSGTGCLAERLQDDRLTETIEVGRCTADTFPSVSEQRPVSQNPLNASSTPSEIYLLSEGKLAKALRAGTYWMVVTTAPGRSTFHLRGPGIDRTAKPGSSRVSWAVTLRRGTYRYWSENAPKRRKSFTVA